MTQQELKARIAALEAMMRRLQDIEEIKQLMWSYTYFLDYGELDKVMDCFVDDAKLEVGMRGGTEKGKAALEGRYEGKEAIKWLYSLVQPSKDRFAVSHLILNPVVKVEGERAQGTFYLLEPSGIERAMWGHGRYDMEYIRVDGKWKISSFRFTWNFMTPYDEGWVKTPMVGF